MKKVPEPPLPPGWRTMRRIDLRRDVGLAVALNVGALLLLAAALLPVFLGMRGRIPAQAPEVSAFRLLALWLGSFAVLMVCHEALHGLAFKRLRPQGKLTFGLSPLCAYCGMPEAVWTRREYLFACLLPCGVLSALLLVLWRVLPEPYATLVYSLFAAHLAGCVGDLWMAAWVMPRAGAQTRYRDLGMAFLLLEPAPQARAGGQ